MTNLIDDTTRVIRLRHGLAAFSLLLFVAWPASGGAWIFDDQCATAERQTNLDEYVPPRALIMLDRSGSMGGYVSDTTTRWDAARQAIKDVVGAMQRSGTCSDVDQSGCDRIRFGLGLFWTHYYNGPQTPITDPITEDNLSNMLSTIDNQSPGGGTPTGEATEALRTSPSLDDADQTTNAMLITDGIPTSGSKKALDEICRLRNRSTSPAETFVVGFSSGTNRAYNNLLSAAGGTGHCCRAGESGCSSDRYVDPCAADSTVRDAYVSDALSGSTSALECTGAFQADNTSGLKQSVYDVAEEIACTFELDFPEDTYTTDRAYKDPTATSIRMYHKDFGWIDIPHESLLDDELESKGVVSTTAAQYEGEGWSFKNSSEREKVVFSDKLCGDLLSGSVETVETQVACDCPKTGQSCQIEDRDGVCAEGQYICSIPPGENVCKPLYNEDETIGTLCDVPGKQGRCSVGVKVCSDGSTKCKQIKRPMPEICNGLDDDCNGLVDDIHSSWSRRHSDDISISTSSLTCGGRSSCSCPPGGADTRHRGNGADAEEEFESMVANTQTQCRCRE